MNSRSAVIMATLLALAVPALGQVAQTPKIHPVEKLTLTHYFYWYQGDPRKPAPQGHVKYGDGASALSFAPSDGIGPWMSSLRAQWHKDQLTDIRKAGIDVILPVYWGDAANKQFWSIQGLDCLVQALKEASAEDKETPQVGMFFDTSAMAAQYGNKAPDLRQEEVKQTFYGMIRDFFLHIPPEFRAEVKLPAESGGGEANIVLIYTPAFFSDWDAGFVDYCKQRFEKDFGAKLIMLGDPAFKPKAPNLDGYVAYGAGLGLKYDEGGWLKLGAVGAGYDDSAVRGRKPQIRVRMFGENYRKDWETLLAKDPNWVVIDGWNEWHEGSQIAPDRLSGYQMVDFSRLYVTRFNGMREPSYRIISPSVSGAMIPKGIYQVDLSIRNTGKGPWRSTDMVSVSYRWFKDGKALDEDRIRVLLAKTVVAGATARARLGISSTTANGEPLQDGDYELRIDLSQPDIGWFEDHGNVALRVPVRIGKPADCAASFLSSTLPTIMKTGRSYPVRVRVRNEGSETWKKGGVVEIGYSWRKVGSYLHGSGVEVDEPFGAEIGRAQIPYDVEPGRIADLPVTVKTSAAGAALPIWKPENPWTYQIQWELLRGGNRLGESAGIRREVAEILADDYGVSFLGSNLPRAMNAGAHTTVNLGIRNNGSETWNMLKYRVGYHWYYFDGAECIWDGEKTLLPQDVAPGESVVVHDMKVLAPPTAGPLVLVYDLYDGERWASTASVAKGGDALRTSVYINARNYPVFDLSKLCNTNAFSSDADRSVGDFDGQGHSFSWECLPPELNIRDVNPDAYPCGYLSAESGERIMSSRRIVFHWPSKTGLPKTAVSCTGQSVGMTPDRFLAFHILGAATSPDAKGDFIVKYSNGSTLILPVTMTLWTDEPKHGEHVAATSLHRHSKDADEPGVPCYLYHYILQVDRSLPIVGIAFPNNPAMKVVALTGQTIITVEEPRVNPLVKKLEDKLKNKPKE